MHPIDCSETFTELNSFCKMSFDQIKQRQVGGDMTPTEKRNSYRVLVGKQERKREAAFKT